MQMLSQTRCVFYSDRPPIGPASAQTRPGDSNLVGGEKNGDRVSTSAVGVQSVNRQIRLPDGMYGR